MAAKRDLLLNHGLLLLLHLLTGVRIMKTGKLIHQDGRVFIASTNIIQFLLAPLSDAKLLQLFTHILTLFHLILLLGVRTINTGKLMISGYLNKDLYQHALQLAAKKDQLLSHGQLPLQPQLTGDKRTKTGKPIHQDGRAHTVLSNLIKNQDQLAPLSNAKLVPLLSILLHQIKKSRIMIFQTLERTKKSLPPSNTSLRLKPNMANGT
jgi:hypothetical protein